MNDTSLRIIVPIGTALLGFVLSYILERLKERNIPRHQISWSAITQPGMVQTLPDLQSEISLSYKGSKVQDLTVISCTIENTGNRVIKNQLIRFEFPLDCVVLDTKLDPEPQRELGIRRAAGEEDGPHETIYRIGHLEKSQQVYLRLLASGREAGNWRVHAFNEDGDVEFRKRDASRSSDDSKHFVPFFVYLIIMVTIATISSIPIFELPHEPLFQYLFVLAEIALAALLATHAFPVARLLKEYLLAQIRVSVEDPSVVVYGGSVHDIIVNRATTNYRAHPAEESII